VKINKGSFHRCEYLIKNINDLLNAHEGLARMHLTEYKLHKMIIEECNKSIDQLELAKDEATKL